VQITKVQNAARSRRCFAAKSPAGLPAKSTSTKKMRKKKKNKNKTKEEKKKEEEKNGQIRP
jgi:ribosomal protein L12E/L44/L45/RPP1/RPP2